jgi:Zn ribbon nucleic-acid-binding protein
MTRVIRTDTLTDTAVDTMAMWHVHKLQQRRQRDPRGNASRIMRWRRLQFDIIADDTNTITHVRCRECGKQYQANQMAHQYRHARRSHLRSIYANYD